MNTRRIATPYFHSRSTHRALMYVFTNFAANPGDQPSPRPSARRPPPLQKTASHIHVKIPDYRRTLTNHFTALVGHDHRPASPLRFPDAPYLDNVQRMTEAPAFPLPDLA